jgi:hypothetical protein
VVRDQAAPQLLRLQVLMCIILFGSQPYNVTPQMFPDETVRSSALEATSVLAAAVNVR